MTEPIGLEDLVDHSEGRLRDDARVLLLHLRRGASGLRDRVGRFHIAISLDLRDDIECREVVLHHQLVRIRHVREPPVLRKPVGKRAGVEDEVQVGDHCLRLTGCEIPVKGLHLLIAPSVLLLGGLQLGQPLTFPLGVLRQRLLVPPPCGPHLLLVLATTTEQTGDAPRRLGHEGGLDRWRLRLKQPAHVDRLLQLIQIEVVVDVQRGGENAVQSSASRCQLVVHGGDLGGPRLGVETLPLALTRRDRPLVLRTSPQSSALSLRLRAETGRFRARRLALHPGDRRHESPTTGHSESSRSVPL